MKYIFTLFILTNIHTSYSQQIFVNLENDLQKELDRIILSHQIPGIIFSIQFDNKHQINLASGYADVERKTLLLPDSRMLSGSVGKLFFSAVILKLVQEGKISLEDNVSKYLGNSLWYNKFPNHQDIKILNLLNHTSGLPRHLFQKEFLEDFIKSPLKKRKPEDCIQSIANKAPLHPVGQGWAYSDTNYILLGLIIEKITKENIYALVEKEIINPLQLSLTTPSNTITIKGLATGYIGSQNPFQLPKKVLDNHGKLVLDPAFEWTGGGYATNPQDLTKLIKFIHESDYLNEQTKTELRKALNMTTGEPYDSGYGLGTFVWSKMNDTRYGHSGFFPGYVSHVEYSTLRQYAIAIQINDDGAYPLLQQVTYDLEKIINTYLDKIDEAKILRNFTEQENCWNSSDIECYMEAYAKTEPIQTASRAGITYGYDNIIGDYKKYYPKDRMGKLHFDNIKMRRLSDNLYYVTGRFNLKHESREELQRGWFSVNAKKINGEWLMITDHSS